MIKRKKTNSGGRSTRNGQFVEQELFHDRDREEKRQRKSKRPITPLNDTQESYIKAIYASSLVITLGPAGTGKTWLPSMICSDMMMNRQIDTIVLSRPMEGPGRAIGTLPGTKDEKMYDWLIPLTATIRNRMGPGAFDHALKSKNIDLCPLNQIKGRSFDDSFVIIDEAEDIDMRTMKSVVTRIGQNTKVVINGDIKQKHIHQESGLGWLVYIVKKYNLPIPIIEFTVEDCVRGPITKMFLEVFEKEEDEKFRR